MGPEGFPFVRLGSWLIGLSACKSSRRWLGPGHTAFRTSVAANLNTSPAWTPALSISDPESSLTTPAGLPTRGSLRFSGSVGPFAIPNIPDVKAEEPPIQVGVRFGRVTSWRQWR